ncbi:MAG: tetratricopeptide repeat protein [Gemmatimonadales bacterium]
MNRPLEDVDSAERTQLIRIAVLFGPACFIMVSFGWYFLREKEMIPGWLFVVLVILDLPLVALAVLGIHRATSRASSGLVHALYSAGNIPPPRTYPRQEVLAVRGQYREAAAYYRDHLTLEPDDNEARLRLADLLEKHLDDPAGAERLLLDVRRLHPDRGHEMRAANGLIDLYRKQGRRDRLLVELARFADRYRGTPGAEAATRLLQELKAEGS